MMDDNLEITTGKINAIWQKTDDYQATLGVLMVKAKELVEAGDPFADGLRWPAYVSIHFKKSNGESRSLRNVQHLLQIGKAPDPEEKAKEIRLKNSDQMKKKRATRVAPDPSPEDPRDEIPFDPLAEIKFAWRRLTKTQQEAFMVWTVKEGGYDG